MAATRAWRGWSGKASTVTVAAWPVCRLAASVSLTFALTCRPRVLTSVNRLCTGWRAAAGLLGFAVGPGVGIETWPGPGWAGPPPGLAAVVAAVDCRAPPVSSP